MKWLADENIPSSAIAFLRQRGQEVFSVAKLVPGAPDQRVIQIAVERQCILLSFDRDIGDLIFGRAVMSPLPWSFSAFTRLIRKCWKEPCLA